MNQIIVDNNSIKVLYNENALKVINEAMYQSLDGRYLHPDIY